MDLVKILSTLPFEEPKEVDRRLNYKKVSQYKSQLFLDLQDNFTHKEIKDIITIIYKSLDDVKYTKYHKFMMNLEKSFDAFTHAIGDTEFYLIIDGDKIGSEIWLIQKPRSLFQLMIVCIQEFICMMIYLVNLEEKLAVWLRT